MSTNPGVGFSRERIKRDSMFWWRPGRISIPIWQMSGLVYNTTTSTNIKSANKGGGANEVLNGALNSTGLTGFTMTPSSDKPTVDHMLEVPYDMDFSKHIYWSVTWACSGTSGSMLWTIKYNGYILGDTTNGVIADPASGTALDFAIPSQTVLGTAYTIQRTKEGWINPSLAQASNAGLKDTVEYIHFQLAADTLTTITSVIPLAVNIRYTPRRCYYEGMEMEAKAPTYIASNKYPNT